MGSAPTRLTPLAPLTAGTHPGWGILPHLSAPSQRRNPNPTHRPLPAPPLSRRQRPPPAPPTARPEHLHPAVGAIRPPPPLPPSSAPPAATPALLASSELFPPSTAPPPLLSARSAAPAADQPPPPAASPSEEVAAWLESVPLRYHLGADEVWDKVSTQRLQRRRHPPPRTNRTRRVPHPAPALPRDAACAASGEGARPLPSRSPRAAP